MTEEKRKEDVLKQYKDLPKGVVKYIDFLITKINKLVSENTRLAKHIIELQKDKGELVDKTKELQHRLDVAQGFLDRDMEYNHLLDVINNQDVKIADLEKQIEELKVEIEKLKYKEENYLQKIEHKEEVIKTLQNRIEKMKCCENCKHKKAKEIIKSLLTLVDPIYEQCEEYCKILEQAEQFIKENEQ